MLGPLRWDKENVLRLCGKDDGVRLEHRYIEHVSRSGPDINLKDLRVLSHCERQDLGDYAGGEASIAMS